MNRVFSLVPAALRGSIAFILTYALVTPLSLSAQQANKLSGTVVDAANGDPLPFATIGLKRQLSGVTSNEEGHFDFFLPPGSESDTLVVTVCGFARKLLPLKDVNGEAHFRMERAAVEIEEVQVRPHPPVFYVREAMRRLRENYPASPFESVAYYRERIKENGAFVQCDEGIFRSFYPNYLDTVKSQDQLLLFRHADDIHELAFMSRDRKKDEEKEKRKKAKKGAEAKDTASNGFRLGLSSFGGPQSILKSSKLSATTWGFLDTTQLSEYDYSFDSGAYGDLMVIAFRSRGRVGYLRESGRLFIDRQSLAIVQIENSGDFVVPLLVRPILFAAGLAVKEPRFSRNLLFREAGGRWYPQSIRYDIDVRLTKRYFFAPNDHSHLEVNQVFAVNELVLEDPRPVPVASRFDPRREMKDQVRTDRDLSWEGLNVVK